MNRIMIAALATIALSAGAAGAQARATAAKTIASSAAPVNLNTATMDQLTTIPGVGAKTAERIIAYRQKNGGFKKIEDLMNVGGVGEKSFLKMKPLITVATVKVSTPDE
jgi:competence protein ComEA